jgi:hypothetical protein
MILKVGKIRHGEIPTFLFKNSLQIKRYVLKYMHQFILKGAEK